MVRQIGCKWGRIAIIAANETHAQLVTEKNPVAKATQYNHVRFEVAPVSGGSDETPASSATTADSLGSGI